MSTPLWQPSQQQIEKTLLTAFTKKIQQNTNCRISNIQPYTNGQLSFRNFSGKKSGLIVRCAAQCPGLK